MAENSYGSGSSNIFTSPNSTSMLQRYLILSLIGILTTRASAEHLLGGTISTRCTGGNFHEITLKLFRACSGSAMVPQNLRLTNDCGVVFDVTGLEPQSVVEVSPLCADQIPNSTCNGGNLVGLELYTYTTIAYLSPCDSWNINWSICCRTGSLNLEQTPGLWIENVVNNAGGRCNAAPVFVDNTIPLVCVGQPVSYDASATDADGNTLRYRFIDARFGAPEPTPVIYSGGYSGAEPFTGMVLDSITGRITFQPTVTGYIVTVVEVSQYDDEGVLIGTAMRDFPFIVSACDNSVPSISSGTFTNVTGPATISGDRSLLICSEAAFCASLNFTDSDLGQALTITSNIADVLPGATMEVVGTNPATVEICWNSTGAEEGDYQFTMTATDDACPVEGFQQFAYTVTFGSAGLAGVDTDEEYCTATPPFALIDVLDGNPSAGGTWTDGAGAPFDGFFTPGEDAPGDYVYTFTGSEDCTASATLSLILREPNHPLCIGLSVPERSGTTVRVLPDASDGARFQLIASQGGTFDIAVLSSDGRWVLGQRVRLTTESTHPLDLSGLSPGAYVLRMVSNTGGGLSTARIVVR